MSRNHAPPRGLVGIQLSLFCFSSCRGTVVSRSPPPIRHAWLMQLRVDGNCPQGSADGTGLKQTLRTGGAAPRSNGSRLRVTHTGDPHITRPSVALHATRQTHVTTGSRSQTDGAGDVALQAWVRCAPNVLPPQPLVAHSGVRAGHRSGFRVFKVRRTAAVQVSICAAPDLGSENEAKNCNVGCVAQCCRLNGPGAQYASGVRNVP